MLLGNHRKELSAKDITREIIRREKAKARLIDFCKFVDPNYEAFPIHYYIAERLEAVESGKIRRLAIFVPPAIGKSRLASELFPAWCFGRSPRLEYIQTSYDHSLASGFGRNVRNIIKEPKFQALFPASQLSIDATAMDEWKTTADGEYKAEGAGGGLIGFHANILCIDDPFKNPAAAGSLNHRETIWSWYAGVVLNRLRSYANGPGSVILIMQRWNDDDLGGRIEKVVEAGEEHWEIIRIPSIADAQDPLGREEGAPLLPEGPNQRTLAELIQIRARNPRLFQATHQQEPVSDEGDIFRPDWLRLYRPSDLPKKLSKWMASDYALTKGSGDYTVHLIVGVCGDGHIWILDLWRKQVGIEDGEGITKACDLMKAYRPRKCFLEKVSMSKMIGAMLQKAKAAAGAYTVLDGVTVIGRGSKDSDERAGNIAGAMQMGYVHVPFDAPWLGELQYELSRFPNGRYDDQVDTLSLIGMKLDTLRGPKAHTISTDEIPTIQPTNWTFDEALRRNTRKRLGLRVRREAVVVPTPPPSVLDLESGEDEELLAQFLGSGREN